MNRDNEATEDQIAQALQTAARQAGYQTVCRILRAEPLVLALSPTPHPQHQAIER